MPNYTKVRQSVSRKDPWKSYDNLPIELKRALQDSLNDWAANDTYNFWRKHGIAATISWLRAGDDNLVKRGFEFNKKRTILVSTAVAPFNVAILRNYNEQVSSMEIEY